MKPFVYAILALAVSVGSLSLGSILLKMGMDRYGTLTAAGMPAFQAFLKTPQLPAGSVLMLVQFAGTLLLFKWGWDASVVIPMLGLSYVITALLSKWMLNEPVGLMRWLGIVLIVAGIFCIARSVGQAKMP